jgi:hypothetical protein
MTKPKTVRLYPVPGVSVYPYPSEEFDADEATAAALLAHIPPPFTTEPPQQAPSPSETAPDAP